MAWWGSRCKTLFSSRPARAFCPSPSRACAWRNRAVVAWRNCKVVVEQQHRGQRGGEVIDLRFRPLQLLGIGQAGRQEASSPWPCGRAAARPARRSRSWRRRAGSSSPRSRPGRWRPRANAGGRRTFRPARPGAAEPILHVALVGQQVPRLAEVLGRRGRGLKMGQRGGGVCPAPARCGPGPNGCARTAPAPVLRRLPRAENFFRSTASAPSRAGRSGCTGRRVRRSGRRGVRPVPRAFPTRGAAWPANRPAASRVDRARRGCVRCRVGAEGLFVGRPGLGRLPAKVEVADAEVPPDHGIMRIAPGTPLPQRHGLLMAATIVEQVAEVVGRPGVVGISADRGLQDGDFLQPRREAIVGRPAAARRSIARACPASPSRW